MTKVKVQKSYMVTLELDGSVAEALRDTLGAMSRDMWRRGCVNEVYIDHMEQLYRDLSAGIPD